ncbi:MAG: glycoside hydrolase family 97 protein [Lentimicrobium sp.]|uniref:glycoside hydrolase family 97 protein n=1 Tax=Lentimicrobium sp. TaxID=2034841 RepID=UPI0025F32A67|nr:glycoside hydrolase family 97 protein [Lentimicrobium sp.]MCO5255113.1 glycoside hydrolase family 97 protein [Lentimicrobium sp.]
MNRIIFFIIAFCFLMTISVKGQHLITSPDGRLALQVNAAGNTGFTVFMDGKETFTVSGLGLELESGEELPAPGTKPAISRSSGLTEYQAVVPVKYRQASYPFNRLELKYRSGSAIEFRVYNDGVAYRFITSRKGLLKVNNEGMRLNFPEGSDAYFPRESSMYSHYERPYLHQPLDSIAPGDFCSLPVLFTAPGKIRVLFTEADLFDYPNAFLKKDQDNGFHAVFPGVVLKALPRGGTSDRSEDIAEQACYIAEIQGDRSFPWRVFAVSQNDASLAGNDLVYRLSRPSELKDTEWIRPGKVAWDWYNASNITGVDFRSGINTETYRYYIDFAAAYGIEYVMLDEGWSKTTTNVLETIPGIDLPELIEYAASKQVGIILWLLWHPLNGNEEKILSTYRDWGVKGVKVDFMQRADQGMVSSYEKIAAVAAANHLLVDFHGAYKPAGLNRAYPNVLSFEGVMGNENNKWSNFANPEHNVTLPFIRMVAGPMDYTPGAMRNAQKDDFCINFDNPSSLGTRAHQVAMYVVYESPLQMLCDAPSLYLREPEVPEFISRIPVVWDETRVLQGEVGDYILIARRNGDTWYLAAMTDWSSRNLETGLSFLGEGVYQATIFKDGPNADKNASDYLIRNQHVRRNDNVLLNLAPGGGWVAIVSPAN